LDVSDHTSQANDGTLAAACTVDSSTQCLNTVDGALL
jgi:hypothetical protein